MRHPKPVLLAAALCLSLACGVAPALASASTASVLLDKKDKDDKDKEDKDEKDNGNWKDGTLQLLSSRLPSLLPGQAGWVGLSWTADANVCDVQITATADGSTITYPANTGSYTSLYYNDALAATNRDYSALKIQLPAKASGDVSVNLKATFSRLPPGQIKKDDDLTFVDPDCSKGVGGGVVESTVTVPVDKPTGPEVSLETSSVTVGGDEPTWVELTFATEYAGLDDFRVALKPPSGLEVVYPGDATSSGLANEPGLPVGGSDQSAVRLDASGLDGGTYQVPVTMTWSGGSAEATLTVTVK